ncbi:uncharacterized protein LOC118199856 [Stegodyphus dumicola]|uniref:uncharacterized protein LOC118199856 n=1 Tax=Stegodyphus dumicola TaxID=202533 RepID=UPI0015A87164|nr:uncharacterized protein LOC118199856 [Stegodyphus dumicola]
MSEKRAGSWQQHSSDEMAFEKGIWSAALDGDVERLKHFLYEGVDPSLCDSSGYTALVILYFLLKLLECFKGCGMLLLNLSLSMMLLFTNTDLLSKSRDYSCFVVECRCSVYF